MISWPSRAAGALVKLFEPLQDINVFVEDKGDEAFYTHLLKRIPLKKGRSVQRVFSLGDRSQVIRAAQAYTPGGRKSLFIVDGDFEWLRGEASPFQLPWLVSLEAYCIENLLICEEAAIQILVEELVLLEDEVVEKLSFQKWQERIQIPLIELFVAYAICNKISPDYPTISNGIGRFCTQSDDATCLDLIKVDLAIEHALGEAVNGHGAETVASLLESYRRRVYALKDPLTVVSGKDVLLPLLDFEFRRLKCRINRRSLRLKLALKCNVSNFDQLQAALNGA